MGCKNSTAKGPAIAKPPANAFLAHYTLGALGSRDVFGPFLKLRSYDPDTGSYQLTVLVVCSKAAQERLGAEPRVTWSEQADAGGGVFSLQIDQPDADAASAAGQQSAAGQLLHTWREWCFWRFPIVTVCDPEPKQLRYQVSLVPEAPRTVTVPPRGRPWNWAFCSCNGLGDPAKKDATGGLQPMWGDLLKRHADRPLNVMVGGGDQIYNDGVFAGPLLVGWDRTLSETQTDTKTSLPFTDAMRDEVEAYYFAHYCVHSSQPVYCDALASIPSVNIWDDHDIFDGWGSYPDHILQAAVLQGVFRAAQRFYHLFQLHTTSEHLADDGYFCGTSSITRFGDSTAIVMPDTRTSRTLSQICQPEFYSELRDRLEGLPDTVRHVVLVLTVPILWPALNVIQLLQKLSDKVTRDTAINEILGVTGLLRRLPLRFGEIEILDDMLDHWDAKPHVAEHDALLKMLMELADAKGFRVTFLSGDVHCAGYGMFHSRGTMPESEVASSKVPDADALAADPRFMPQIVSSAIANVPPPSFVVNALGEAGEKPKAVLQNCVARFVPLEPHFKLGIKERDVTPIGERNWCEVSQESPDADMVYDIRCEKELGTGHMHVYTIEVPALKR